MSPPMNQIPKPLTGREEGTWARYTIRVRFQNILQRTMSENDFPPSVDHRLEKLGTEIPKGPIRKLRDDHAPDTEDWQSFIAPYEGADWLAPPWFFVEHYFYRRIMEAVDYFDGGPDPFRWQKEQGLKASQGLIQPLAKRVGAWVKAKPLSLQAVEDMIFYNLWGNQADLSLWPADSERTPIHENLEEANRHLLADESGKALALIEAWRRNQARMDFIIDNAGFELVGDLAFADLLLSTGWVAEARFHVKRHPTFVSDAIEQDIKHTVSVLSASENDAVYRLGRRLQEHVDQDRLSLHPDFFWNSPLAFWELPNRLGDTLGQAGLLISKGDANYRRLVGDRHWSFIIPFTEVVDYLPVPLLALRTLKAEVAIGLEQDEILRAENQDPDWMVDGRWGVVQFAPALGGKGVN